MKEKKILIIDDDIDLCEMVTFSLTQAGATVYAAIDGREGLKLFFEHRPDLVILDIRMPDMDGWETCKQIRMLADTPIIMLTTLHRDHEIIKGLNYGADDFLTKPFKKDLLIARANAVFRRIDAIGAASEKTTHPGLQSYYDDYLQIELNRRKVRVDGEEIKLTGTEFRVLTYLLHNADQILTYESILHNVWGWEYQESIDYVHVYLSHLRKKIERDPRNPVYLVTEYGVGYSFQRMVH